MACALGGLGLTLALVTFGPYPVSMVTLPGDEVSNMTPPSLALLTCSLWLLGLVLLLRRPVSQWVQHRRVWLVVVVANGVVMTAFLWHLSAIIAVNGTLVVLNAPVFPAIGSGEWWLLRVPLLLVTAALLAVVMLALRRFERPRAWVTPSVADRRPRRSGLATLGGILALLGILGLSVAGFAGVLSMRSEQLVVIPMASLPSVMWWALGTGSRCAQLCRRPPHAKEVCASRHDQRVALRDSCGGEEGPEVGARVTNRVTGHTGPWMPFTVTSDKPLASRSASNSSAVCCMPR